MFIELRKGRETDENCNDDKVSLLPVLVDARFGVRESKNRLWLRIAAFCDYCENVNKVFFKVLYYDGVTEGFVETVILRDLRRFYGKVQKEISLCVVCRIRRKI